MKRIGIIATNTYENKTKIRNLLFELKNRFKGVEDIEIISRGNQYGGEKYIRKYCMELDLPYKEFNPAHTTSNLYSAMHENYYGKPFRAYNFIQRDQIFSKYVEVCMILAEENANLEKDINIKTCLKELTKHNKKFVVIS